MISKVSRAQMRQKKHRRLRNHIVGTAQRPRLCVFRSNNHMYAQIIDDTIGNTLVSASTLQKDVKAELEKTNNVDAAAYLGTVLGKNDLSVIPRPLLDRMELIEVGGYITEEKTEIAKRHLVPEELESTGLDKVSPKVSFNKNALEFIIEHYTRESGVRQLKKQIDKSLRKMAYKLACNQELKNYTITPAEVKDLLGNPPFNRDIYQGNDYAGVVTGLAWTSVGGEILYIETSLSKGKAGKLTLTGNLGDVMKESAIIALEYVKSHIDLLQVDYRIFEQWNIHIHVPEGATPKDGPSAGITIATSIASAITQRKVRANTAMTGEITLRGKVLPVGGIKEKILAAKRAGIKHIVMCRENQKNVEEIPEKYLKGVDFHYVENVADVWQFALTDEKVKKPTDFSIEENDKKE